MTDNQKPPVTDQTLNEMVQHIQDPEVRKHYANVIGGIIQREVVCSVGKCVIGHYYSDGQLIEVNTVQTFGKGKNVRQVEHGALSSRQRLDGHMGYHCRCGNDSRLSEAEKGVMSDNGLPPTKGDLGIIFNRLQEKPTVAKVSGENYAVDGFLVRPYTGRTN